MGTNSVENIKQGLSKREALALTRLASQNRTIITINDIQDVLDVPYDAAKKIANNLVHKKWLDRLKSGTYLIVPLAAGETGDFEHHLCGGHVSCTVEEGGRQRKTRHGRPHRLFL